MSEDPPRSLLRFLLVLLSPLALAVALPALADEPAAPLVVEGPEVSLDMKVVEDLERNLDKQLTADVARLVQGVVDYRVETQRRWLAQHYFAATAPPETHPATVSPASVSLASRPATR